jgi:hypothetical protein
MKRYGQLEERTRKTSDDTIKRRLLAMYDVAHASKGQSAYVCVCVCACVRLVSDPCSPVWM